LGSSASLLLVIDNVSVSFDVSSAGLSLPGRLYYVSPGQINLQVPWELRDLTNRDETARLCDRHSALPR
jgi:uncharacterized protein (TIGR03437 family)